MGRRVKQCTYEFAFIIRLIILCNLGDYYQGTVVVDGCIGFEEDEGKWRRLASGFANWSHLVNIHQIISRTISSFWRN
jgi:hypothetical protein